MNAEIRTPKGEHELLNVWFGFRIFGFPSSFVIRHSYFRQSPGGYGAVCDRPLSPGPRPSKNGTAFFAHVSAVGYADAEWPKQLCSMSVLMMPGLSGIAAMPEGNSCASACVRPSIAHLVAQYGATSASVERPQPELKFTITPLPRSIMAGRK